MSKPIEVEVSFKTGGQIQTKKFDESQRYEYSAAVRCELRSDEDLKEVILGRVAELQNMLEPLAQEERDALVEERNRNDARARAA